MAHDVYICYDERDLEIAKQVCDKLEDNGLDCWLKNRDAGVKHMVDEIMEAIKKAKLMVLLYSTNSKQSNFVNNEVDIAFAEKRSILIYQIDESKLEDGLEFFLRNKPWIQAYPNPEEHLDTLVEDASRMVKEQRHADMSISNIIRKHKLKIIGIVAVLLIIGVAGYMMYGNESGSTNATQIKAGDIDLKITDFHVDDVRKEKTDWNYSYFAAGTISPVPGANSGCKIIADFYDESGNLVESIETPFDDAQKVSAGFLFGSTTSGENNIKIADVQLVNSENIIIAQDESQI